MVSALQGVGGKYKPDLLYFDDEELPLGQAGLDMTAHFYNASAKWHGGDTQAVVTAKEYSPAHMGASCWISNAGGRREFWRRA